MAETPLLVALGEYRSQLEQHLAALRERHQQLQTVWLRLREIYEGEGAEVFSEAFETASRRLEDYADGGQDIARQLERKIDELRHFQAPGPTV
jgi:uncharacterized protein YukE